MSAIVWQLGGTILSILGVGALYLAWRKKERDWPLVSAGWSFIIVSIAVWSQTSGVDKGPALGIVVVTLIGLAAVCARAFAVPAKAGRSNGTRPARAGNGGDVSVSRYSAAANITAIIIGGVAVSILACTALFMGNQSLGVEHTTNLTLTMFGFPLLWGALATYIGYSTSTSGRITKLVGLSLISAVIILLSMGAI